MTLKNLSKGSNHPQKGTLGFDPFPCVAMEAVEMLCKLGCILCSFFGLIYATEMGWLNLRRSFATSTKVLGK